MKTYSRKDRQTPSPVKRQIIELNDYATEPEEESLEIAAPPSPRFCPGRRKRIKVMSEPSAVELPEPERKSPLRRERMLGRKPSSSLIRDESPSKTPIKSSSLPDIGSASIRTPPSRQASDPSLLLPTPSSSKQRESISPSPPKRPYSNGARTYAQQRSFLLEASTSNVKLEDIHSQVDALVQQPSNDSYVDMKKKYGIESDDEDAGLTSNDTLGLKGINALRTQGQNKRFDDELAYILDGLDPLEPLGLRRSSAMELLKKCVEGPEFMRKVRMSGYVKNLHRHLNHARGDSQDLILDICLALFLAMVFRDPRDNDSLADLFTPYSDFIPYLLTLLTRPLATASISSDKTSKAISKLERAPFNPLRTSIDAAKLWTDDLAAPKDVTLRRLGLSILSNITSNRPISIGLIQQHTPKLFSLLDDMLEPFPALSEAETASDTIDFPELEALVAVLERCTPPSSAASELDLDVYLSERLACLLSVAFGVACGSDVDQASAAMDCLLSTFKLLINLTHLNPSFAKDLASHDLTYGTLLKCIQSTQDGNQDARSGMEALKVDFLSLCLGFLSNLFESGPASRLHFLNKAWSKSCPGDLACRRSCICADRLDSIYSLARLYPVYATSNTPETNLVFSYIRALLALVTVDLEDPGAGQVDLVLKEELSSAGYEDVGACAATLKG